MKKIAWNAVIFMAILVAIGSFMIASSISGDITGNVVKVSPVTNGTAIYTQAEVDAKINALNSQIAYLNSQLYDINLSSMENDLNYLQYEVNILENNLSYGTCNCPKKGSLYVISSPAYASIYIDNIYWGTTPNTVPSLTVGSHTVKLMLNGYNNYTGTKFVSEGYNSMSVSLSSSTGNLYVTSNPVNASIYVDGVLRGSSPYTVPSLAIGTHTVQLRKTGYYNYTTTKYIYAGSNTLFANMTTGAR
jgi:hypothetical protein